MAGFSSRLREKIESTRSTTTHVQSNNQTNNIRGLTRLGGSSAATPSVSVLPSKSSLNGVKDASISGQRPLPHRGSISMSSGSGLDCTLGGTKIVPGWSTSSKSNDASSTPSGHLGVITVANSQTEKIKHQERDITLDSSLGNHIPWALHQPSPHRFFSRSSRFRRGEEDSGDEKFPHIIATQQVEEDIEATSHDYHLEGDARGKALLQNNHGSLGDRKSNFGENGKETFPRLEHDDCRDSTRDQHSCKTDEERALYSSPSKENSEKIKQKEWKRRAESGMCNALGDGSMMVNTPMVLLRSNTPEASAAQESDEGHSIDFEMIPLFSPSQSLEESDNVKKDRELKQQQNVLRQVAERRAANVADFTVKKDFSCENGIKLATGNENQNGDVGALKLSSCRKGNYQGLSTISVIDEVKQENKSLNPCRIEGHQHDWIECPQNPKSVSFVRNNPCRIEGHEHDWTDCMDNPKSDNYIRPAKKEKMVMKIARARSLMGANRLTEEFTERGKCGAVENVKLAKHFIPAHPPDIPPAWMSGIPPSIAQGLPHNSMKTTAPSHTFDKNILPTNAFPKGDDKNSIELFPGNKILFAELSLPVYENWNPPPMVIPSTPIDPWESNPFAPTILRSCLEGQFESIWSDSVSDLSIET